MKKLYETAIYISHQYVQMTCLRLHITAKEQQTNQISDEQSQIQNINPKMQHKTAMWHCMIHLNRQLLMLQSHT